MLGHIIAKCPTLPEKLKVHLNVRNKLVGKMTETKKHAHKSIVGRRLRQTNMHTNQ